MFAGEKRLKSKSRISARSAPKRPFSRFYFFIQRLQPNPAIGIFFFLAGLKGLYPRMIEKKKYFFLFSTVEMAITDIFARSRFWAKNGHFWPKIAKNSVFRPYHGSKVVF